MSLAPVLKTAIGNLRSGRLEREEQVKQAVILPILQELGWNPADPDSIVPEYPAGPGRVDYALLHYRRPQVFIEAKRRGALDVRAEAQLFGYAANNGVPLLVLTDGCRWDFYLSMADGHPEERRFDSLELRDENGIPAYAGALEAVLCRQDVLSGDARRNAEDRLKSDRERKRAREAIPEAWNALLNEPDELLCDILTEEVQRKTGDVPDRSDVEDFLKNLRPVPARPTAAARLPFRRPAPPAGEKPVRKTGQAKTPGFSDFAESRGAATEANLQSQRKDAQRGERLQDVIYDLMRVLLETHPELLDEDTIDFLENERKPMGTKLGYPLIRRVSEGRKINNRPRYKGDIFAGHWFVCTEWNKAYHRHNARALSGWVESLITGTDDSSARDSLVGIRNRLSIHAKMHRP